MKATTAIALILLVGSCFSCKDKPEETMESKDSAAKTAGEVRFITLDPGHFHAALVQKTMFEDVDPNVHVYAPDGPDVQDHLNRITGFNTRSEAPTTWNEEVYTGTDFFEKMISDQAGNVIVISGNNAKKTDYILEAIKAGFNILADKPMVIHPDKYNLLEEAFHTAQEKGVLLYDIMTERHEITTLLQRELSLNPELFGELEKGTLNNPAVTKESVHHFFKYVSGNPIKRPMWFFDVDQQGEGIVDVTTHLVDLIQWECFPEEILTIENDIEIVASTRWPTLLTPSQFKKVTQADSYPDYLKKDVKNDTVLHVFSNGEINYTLKGIHAKVSVIWNYQAPEGTGDTHYSIMRGTKANLIIQQGEKENYKPTLYVENVSSLSLEDFKSILKKVIAKIAIKYPGVSISRDDSSWIVNIPEKYKLGHEAHFGQVTEKYLGYLKDGKLPDWEVPNMLAKYYITTQALQQARTVK